MEKEIINAKGAPAAVGPYSHAVRAGGFLFTSGQIPLDPVTGNIVAGGITEQADQCMKNLEAVLKEAGLSWGNVVKCTVFITNMADFPLVNEVYGRYFPANPPGRSCIEVSALPKGALVEIELVAVYS